MDVLQLAQCCDEMKMPYKTMATSERIKAIKISISPWACTATAQIPTTAVLARSLKERRYVLMLFFVDSMLVPHAATRPHEGGERPIRLPENSHSPQAASAWLMSKRSLTNGRIRP